MTGWLAWKGLRTKPSHAAMLTKCPLHAGVISDFASETTLEMWSPAADVCRWLCSSSRVGWLKELGASVDHFRTLPGRYMLRPAISHSMTCELATVSLLYCNMCMSGIDSRLKASPSRALLILISALTALISDVVLVTILKWGCLGRFDPSECQVILTSWVNIN